MSSETKAYIAVYGGLLALILAGWIAFSHFEARAYNRVTGANVETIDAMFLQLRVQEAADE